MHFRLSAMPLEKSIIISGEMFSMMMAFYAALALSSNDLNFAKIPI